MAKTPILILHGWARAGKEKKYDAIKALLEKKGYKVYLPDLPGFGSHALKKEELVFEDYIAFVYDYIKKTKEKKVILLGHSFGGRIAIRFAHLYPDMVSSLILTGASGIPRPLPSLKKKLVYFVTKITRPLFVMPPFSFFYKLFRKVVYYAIGEMDYYQSGSLAQTFKNVYRVSIVKDLDEIDIPTLIIWGENDTITPLIDGKYMHEHITNSKLFIVSDATHRLPYEKPQEFANAVISFLN